MARVRLDSSWKCDICEEITAVDGDRAPKGWGQVTMTVNLYGVSHDYYSTCSKCNGSLESLYTERHEQKKTGLKAWFKKVLASAKA